jgi:hypothetical protein
MENQPIQNQSKETYVNPLTAPANYDLPTLLNELKFGRPAESQMLLDKWIAELENQKNSNHQEVTSDTPSNYQRGWNAAQRGLLQNDAWGDTYTDNANNRPSHEELDEWIKGWKAYRHSNEIAKN